MSTRRAQVFVENLPTRSGERTPLRNVQNEIMHCSTPSSRRKSRSMSGSNALKTQKNDTAFIYPDQLPHCTQPAVAVGKSSASKRSDKALPVQGEAVHTGSALGDITIKSFICAGGEVELSDPSRVIDETIVLPKDQPDIFPPGYNNENTCLTDSMSTQGCDDHVDHAYCDLKNILAPAEDGLSFSGALNAGVGSVPQSTHSARVTEESAEVNSADSQQGDATFKSSFCIEVEVSEASRVDHGTNLLPVARSLNNHLLCHNREYLSVIGDDLGVESSNNHADLPCFNKANDMASASGNLPSFSGPSGFGLQCGALKTGDVVRANQMSVGAQTASGELDVTYKSFICTGLEVEVSESTRVSEKVLLLPDQSVASYIPCDDTVDLSVTEDRRLGHAEHPYCNVECKGTGSDVDPTGVSEHLVGNASIQSMKGLDEVACRLFQLSPKQASPLKAEDRVVAPSIQSESDSANCNDSGALARSSSPVDDDDPVINSDPRSPDSVREMISGRDSALGSSSNACAPAVAGGQADPKNHSDVLTELPEFPGCAAGALQRMLSSPVLRATPLTRRGVVHKPPSVQMEDSALDAGLLLANPDSRVWWGALDSPMPLPQFNSTTLGAASCGKPRPPPAPVRETVGAGLEVDLPPAQPPTQGEERPVGFPDLLQGFPEGPLQQQLRHMAQLLILASGKMDTAGNPAPKPGPDPAVVGTAVGSSVCHSVCVGTTPVRLADHSANTSGLFERKRVFSVSDACTSTDSLLWNLAPGSLTSVSKQELEQRLTSTLIMLEVLVQQLAAARGRDGAALPGPSELRDRLVQTDHTELTQTLTYKDLYVTALERVAELELDQNALQNLLGHMQHSRTTVTALAGDTAAALSSLGQIGDLVREDQRLLATQYGQMKSLYDKCVETLGRMAQKVRAALQQREDMRELTEEALRDKHAAFRVADQLRAHSALTISELEESVGSHQELKKALAKTYPEQVQLNKAYVESLNSASELLRGTMNNHASLKDKLKTARCLLQRTTPLLERLNEKAGSAVAERDQALADRDQTQEELAQVNLHLQDARQEIGDLKLQATIMTSELGVLRQKLSEGEEVQADLEMKVTELSATVSSTLASYAFLEKALAAESTKLQQSWNEVKQATDRVNELEGLLGQSELRVSELTWALTQSEEQLGHLQNLTQSQSQKLEELRDVRSQLDSVKEMNEFIRIESDMAREQVLESEATLWANLQGLRERNIQCEDLRSALSQLQAEKEALQVELEDSRFKARSVELDLGEQVAQAVTEVTLLHHTLRTLTNEVHAALTTKETAPLPSLHFGRNPSTSFVDKVMVAIAADQTQASEAQPPSDTTQEPSAKVLGSGSSAFAPVTPRKCQVECPEEEQSSVVELLADLANTVSELHSAVTRLRQGRDAEREASNDTICGLQEEQRSQAEQHWAEVSELRTQLSCLQTQLERDQLALQNKTQEVETMKRLCSKVTEDREFLLNHKSENSELRREVAELRRLLHQSQIESQALREELRNSGSQSAHSMHSMDDKIRLLKEVERLKRTLLEAEEGRAKILDRAKRHHVIHETNQRKVERELKVLDDMIETVRKTLSSVPDVVKNCKELKTLEEYLG
ncbi:sperm-associated antigen 5 [Esox lucius]|uniref:sperm-associated antigen 5 n=1 Tax=Esox lucius TaxID=8010 RepID=UPI001476C1EA|nr:sperm-associated antigen 5 [Esox lucius]